MPTTRSYTGAAKLVAQVNTVTPGGTIAATDTFTITSNGKTLTFTATTTAVADITAGLKALVDASLEPEWQAVEAADNTTYLSLTARTAGLPFTQTSSISNVSGGAAPTLTTATATANGGPEQYDQAANWSGATAPVTGDTVIIEGSFNLRYGTLTGVTLARLIVRDFSGEIGLPPRNTAGYPEYRSQSFICSATVIDVMQGTTSGLLRFNVEAVQTTVNVYETGSPTGDTIKAFTLVGTHASNVVNALGGSVGIATESGEAATVATLRLGGSTAGTLDAEIGEGTTLTTLIQDGGTARIYCDLANGTINAGACYLTDDPDISGTLTVGKGAIAIVNGGPTIAKAVIRGGGSLDLSQDSRALTITDCDLYAGATVNDPFGRATWTNAIVKKQCDFSDLTLTMGIAKAVSFA